MAELDSKSVQRASNMILDRIIKAQNIAVDAKKREQLLSIIELILFRTIEVKSYLGPSSISESDIEPMIAGLTQYITPDLSESSYELKHKLIYKEGYTSNMILDFISKEENLVIDFKMRDALIAYIGKTIDNIVKIDPLDNNQENFEDENDLRISGISYSAPPPPYAPDDDNN